MTVGPVSTAVGLSVLLHSKFLQNLRPIKTLIFSPERNVVWLGREEVNHFPVEIRLWVTMFRQGVVNFFDVTRGLSRRAAPAEHDGS